MSDSTENNVLWPTCRCTNLYEMKREGRTLWRDDAIRDIWKRSQAGLPILFFSVLIATIAVVCLALVEQRRLNLEDDTLASFGSSFLFFTHWRDDLWNVKGWQFNIPLMDNIADCFFCNKLKKSSFVFLNSTNWMARVRKKVYIWWYFVHLSASICLYLMVLYMFPAKLRTAGTNWLILPCLANGVAFWLAQYYTQPHTSKCKHLLPFL